MKKLTDQEWEDCLNIAEGISDENLALELEELARREKTFLEAVPDDNEDAREIILFNLTILSAASGRAKIRIAAKAAEESKEGEQTKSSKAKKGDKK